MSVYDLADEDLIESLVLEARRFESTGFGHSTLVILKAEALRRLAQRPKPAKAEAEKGGGA